MSRLNTALARHRALHRELRAGRAAERDIRRAVAAAPTQESAHEISSLAARR
jgi:hypothetical protein